MRGRARRAAPLLLHELDHREAVVLALEARVVRGALLAARRAGCCRTARTRRRRRPCRCPRCRVVSCAAVEAHAARAAIVDPARSTSRRRRVAGAAPSALRRATPSVRPIDLRHRLEFDRQAPVILQGRATAGRRDSALRGFGCTSTMMPSAPTRPAARHTGGTRSRWPVGMRHVDDDRQQRELLHDRHRRDVEREARRRLERADAALAQDDVRVAVHRDVLARREPLLDRGGHAALEQHRLAATRP